MIAKMVTIKLLFLLDEDECKENPCRNGARCKDTINDYDCGPCPNGFTGINCTYSKYRLSDVYVV